MDGRGAVSIVLTTVFATNLASLSLEDAISWVRPLAASWLISSSKRYSANSLTISEKLN